MTQRISFSIVIIMAILAIGCKSTRVVSFTNSTADFGRFSTYRIVPENEGDGQSHTTQVSIELEEIIAQEIESRNYEYHPRADLRIHYRFIPNSKTDYNVDTYSGYNRYGGGYGSPYSNRRRTYYDPYSNRYYRPYSVSKRSFYEAILLIELRDRTTGKSVWHGSLDLKYTKKSKDQKGILPEAVRQIFTSYPYEAGNNKPIITVEE